MATGDQDRWTQRELALAVSASDAVSMMLGFRFARRAPRCFQRAFFGLAADGITIASVDDDSLVAGWNALHSRQILPGSVLRRVNGQTDLDSMGQDRRGQYANSSHAS
eukprot:s985_g26.t1